MAKTMKHGLSIDVEDYYQIILKDYFSIDTDPSPEVDRNTQWILDLLCGRRVQATFFVLGIVTKHYSNYCNSGNSQPWPKWLTG